MHNLRALFRCDATPQIGLGHVMHCLALAEAWQDQGGSAALAVAAGSPAIEARIREPAWALFRLVSWGRLPTCRPQVARLRLPTRRAALASLMLRVATRRAALVSPPLRVATRRAARERAAVDRGGAAGGGPWLVCDGYHFGAAYQRAVVERGAAVAGGRQLRPCFGLLGATSC